MTMVSISPVTGGTSVAGSALYRSRRGLSPLYKSSEEYGVGFLVRRSVKGGSEMTLEAETCMDSAPC
jgi:hypothetical protein